MAFARLDVTRSLSYPALPELKHCSGSEEPNSSAMGATAVDLKSRDREAKLSAGHYATPSCLVVAAFGASSSSTRHLGGRKMHENNSFPRSSKAHVHVSQLPWQPHTFSAFSSIHGDASGAD